MSCGMYSVYSESNLFLSASAGLWCVGLRSAFPLFLLDALVDFFAVDGNVFWRAHPDSNLIPFGAKHSHLYIVPDIQGLADTSC
jgi:hypothetical protein